MLPNIQTLRRVSMSPRSRKEYRETIFLRYKKATRREKSKILDEFCATCGCHRKMVSEKNLEFMRESNARYLVGTPKSLLKKFEQELLGRKWEEVGPGVEVNLVQSPEGKGETFVLCRSLGRKEKENAILNRFVIRLEEKLTKLVGEADKGRIRDRQKVERQIGRLLERNNRAASLFAVTVTEKDGRIAVNIKKNEERFQWAMETGGSYILRTNWTEADPRVLWKTYIQLTEVEDAFSTTKHDLGMRPIFHQKKKQNSGPYPGLFPLPGDVEDPPAVDEDVGPGHYAEKAAHRNEADTIP
jgi:hypothetical protein